MISINDLVPGVIEALGVMNLEGFGIDLEHKGLGLLGPDLCQDVLKVDPGIYPGLRSIARVMHY